MLALALVLALVDRETSGFPSNTLEAEGAYDRMSLHPISFINGLEKLAYEQRSARNGGKISDRLRRG